MFKQELWSLNPKRLPHLEGMEKTRARGEWIIYFQRMSLFKGYKRAKPEKSLHDILYVAFYLDALSNTGQDVAIDMFFDRYRAARLSSAFNETDRDYVIRAYREITDNQHAARVRDVEADGVNPRVVEVFAITSFW
ncbi:MAG: hypothetical protein WBG08_14445 [Litorimonas sp.]